MVSSASLLEKYIVPNITVHFPDFKIQCTHLVIIGNIFISLRQFGTYDRKANRKSISSVARRK